MTADANSTAPLVAGLAVGVAFLISFSYFSANTVFPFGPNYKEAVITLERTICYGSCPDYSLTVFGNGTVMYEGHKHVAIVGRHTLHVSERDVQKLADYFYSIGYFSLKDEYYHDSGATGDAPTTTTSIRIDDRFKRIADNYEAPEKLRLLEDKIDEVSGSAKWVKCPEGQQVATIESGGCRERA